MTLGLFACRGADIAPVDSAGKFSAAVLKTPQRTVRIVGSDTMINLVQAWAERYQQHKPDAVVEVAGGGSGVGIAALIEGITDIAAASRELSEDERQRAIARGRSPVEYAVALDALAVYVHASNPIRALSLRQLAEIYGDDGRIRRWSTLVAHPRCPSDTIVRIGRQNSSGTYAFFRERVLGPDREFALGSIDQSGSKDVVALVAKVPCAIGYSGAAYASAGVATVAVRTVDDGPAVLPTVSSAGDGSYPIARRLYLYTTTPATPAVGEFVEWVVSAAGQQIVGELGFVPGRQWGS